MKDVKIGYMCKVDFEHELEHAAPGSTVYPSINALIEDKHCSDECGIVKVQVSLIEVVQAGKH